MSKDSQPVDAAPLAGKPPKPLWLRGLGVLSVLCGLTVAAVMGTRTLSSEDLGYHLDYGRHLSQTGQPVDTGSGISATPPLTVGLTDPPGSTLPEPGPGCWYDEAGNYRFPNANWLSQGAMYAAYAWAGPSGLSGLQLELALTALVGLAVAMLRRGVPGWLIGPGLILIAWTSYERLDLRPELFSLAVLGVMLAVVSGRRIGWVAVAALIVLQLLFVNLHSYWLLGLAVVGAVLADLLARWLWWRRQAKASEEAARWSAQTRRLAVAVGGMSAACFVNPWTWRLVALPFQTLVFLREHTITAGNSGASSHPWAAIGEFYKPFAPGAFQGTDATVAFAIVLALAGLAIPLAMWKRRWAGLLMLVGFIAVGLSMRRNIAPAAAVLVTVSLGAWTLATGPLLARLGGKVRRIGPAATVGLTLLVSAYLGITLHSNRFYARQGLITRTGWGLNELALPVPEPHPKLLGGQLVWTDYNASSNVAFFNDANVPIVTNTWAYPPATMQQNLDVSRGRIPPTALAANGWGFAKLRVDGTSAPLARSLAASQEWRVVGLDGPFVTFTHIGSGLVDDIGPVREEDNWLDDYAARLRLCDPTQPAYALNVGAFTLFDLGWNDEAETLFRQTVDADPFHAPAWNMLGLLVAMRADGEQARRDPAGRRRLLSEAESCFRRALSIDPDNDKARHNLQNVRSQMR